MQRADQWVTGFQKHRYEHALWHNKLSPLAGTYFLCLSPMGQAALGLLEKYLQWSKVCEGQPRPNGRGISFDSTTVKSNVHLTI